MENTEKKICEAMIGLMKEKSFSKIKVTELTRAAGVSRSTFYTYYDSIFEVLQAIEDDFLSHLTEEKKVNVTNDASEIERTYSYIRDHLETFGALTGPNGDPCFIARMETRSKRVLSNIASEKNSSMTKTQLAIVNEFARAGKLEVFRWWGEHKNEVSVNEVVDMLEKLVGAVHDIVSGK